MITWKIPWTFLKYHDDIVGKSISRIEWIEWLVFMGGFPISQLMDDDFFFDILGSTSPGTDHHLEAAQISYLWIQSPL